MSKSSGMEPVLEIRGLSIELTSKEADRQRAVDNLNLDVHAGEIVCVVGESGSGKSMTAHAIMKLLPAEGVRLTHGSIKLEGRDLVVLDEKAMRRLRGAGVGMIFQEPLSALNPLNRIGVQIEETFKLHSDLGKADRRARVLELIAQVGLPDPFRIAQSYPFQLSGGQRQRAMIAMALALRPALLIADEPTTALDVTAQMQILRLIKTRQQETGMGVILITHDFGVVAEIADRVVVMQHGRAVEQGAVADVLGAPQHPYTRQLIAAVPHLVPRKSEIGQAEKSKPLIRVEHLSKAFRGSRHSGHLAVDDVCLEIARGETLGIVGESGSGKSTMARCVVRLVKPDSGSILFGGREITAMKAGAFRHLRPKIQMIFQDPYSSLNPRQSVGDAITEAPILHGVPKDVAWRRCFELLSLVGLDPAVAARYPHQFSGGQRQRIGIARALALEPEIVIADEPVSALDVSVQAQVLDLLDDIRRRLNLAVLFITHDLRVAAQVCDRIGVMRRGRIVETGPTDEIFRNPSHDYTRALLDAIPGREAMSRYRPEADGAVINLRERRA